jgi:hypothetical protein
MSTFTIISNHGNDVSLYIKTRLHSLSKLQSSNCQFVPSTKEHLLVTSGVALNRKAVISAPQVLELSHQAFWAARRIGGPQVDIASPVLASELRVSRGDHWGAPGVIPLTCGLTTVKMRRYVQTNAFPSNVVLHPLLAGGMARRWKVGKFWRSLTSDSNLY